MRTVYCQTCPGRMCVCRVDVVHLAVFLALLAPETMRGLVRQYAGQHYPVAPTTSGVPSHCSCGENLIDCADGSQTRMLMGHGAYFRVASPTAA